MRGSALRARLYRHRTRRRILRGGKKADRGGSGKPVCR
nr:MAG TPA: hypothetical protein [Caudoviricetes sp.]